ncbi:hypothetical protein H0H92_006789 [Tricholoma furcatifolium]|nr:hypothetical protein H0H92_006789 [Tricholoma furcatifolium]
MDQDSFRRLLQTSRAAGSSSSSISGFTKSQAKPKTVEASQPVFKPRKVKKNGNDAQYRDRAAERREGAEGDYAQVEAVLEDFEKRAAGQDKSTLDAQRRYLGGDATHTVLVKGLDFSLLEQNRARAALGEDALADDESLEQAFAESQAQPTKRTREELIRALKAQRTGQADDVDGEGEEREAKTKTREEEARVLEDAKRAGKFKPIGFTPIGGGEKKKKKAKEGAGDGEKKKKRRVENTQVEASQANEAPRKKSPIPAVGSSHAVPSRPPPELEVQALPEDFDIFADAGDYEGIQLDSDSDNENTQPPIHYHSDDERDLDNAPTRKWIDTGSPAPEAEPSKPDLLKSVLASSSSAVAAAPSQMEEREEGEEEEQPMRLVPLESSALPSIKDFLAAEAAGSGSGKRRKRKGGAGGDHGGEKGEKKGAKDAEARAERDYKRLKSYTDQKAAR